MGRETWIYQLNKKTVAEKLYPILKANRQSKQSFYHFYEKTKNARVIIFEKLIEEIKADIQQVSPFQWFQIINWIKETEKCLSVKEYGIELLYESSTKSIANGWMLQFGAYSNCFDFSESHKQPYFGVNLGKDYFIGFVNYLFCLMAKIVQENYSLSPKEQIEYDTITTLNKEKERFWYLIEQEFKILKNDWQITENQRKKGINTQITVAANTYYAAETILADCFRIKKQIDSEKANIIIIDWI